MHTVSCSLKISMRLQSSKNKTKHRFANLIRMVRNSKSLVVREGEKGDA